ncbi:MAG: crossover junction endodeoxyribonuclease RuvC [Bacillus thermozeamaize]|uniref:Crossover junction endodeoxyribonuclease RuvC n=1 Tax=Bacillus thermozeamaize TaxID=230954 RepID=A0A1Y3PJB8_9BACI|nr:MAG: crossover junction endodeoxyribonuclease RuvC [Bacillus thermozeamaize]
MRIMGIDPGLAIVGYGIVDESQMRIRPVQYGCIRTPAEISVAERLERIYKGVSALIEEYAPDCLAVEELYFNRNVTTAFTVGQARGVILLAAVQHGVPVYEYTPLQVKQGVVGYGRADKQQVQEMVQRLLSLSEPLRPDDVADALAVALCHAFRLPLLRRVGTGVPRG